LVGLDLLVARLEDSDAHFSLALFESLNKKDVGTIAGLKVSVGASNLLQICVAQHYAPVETEPVEAAENVSLFVIGDHLEMLFIINVEMPVVRQNAQLVDEAKFDLGA
jgi:hypothetical protein